MTKLSDIILLKPSSKKKTVEEYLNEVSYDLDPDYSPTIFAMKFVNFIKLVNGSEGEENLTPILHYQMLDAVASPNKLIANMVHRGAAKTTIFGEYMALYLATFQELPYMDDVSLSLYVSDSIENGIKNMRKNLEFRWENSEFLQKFVPEARFTDIRWEFTNADNKKMVMKGYGAKALSLDTRLYTPKGYTTIGQCNVGDYIYGPDGELAEITQKSVVFNKPMYALVLEDGRELKVSEDHINSVVVNTKPNGLACWVDEDLTTKELLELGWNHTKLGNKNHKGVSNKCILKVRNTEPLNYPEKMLPVDSYTLGLILGDGSIKKNASGIVITGDEKDVCFYKELIPYDLGTDYADKRRPNVITFAIKGINSLIRELNLDVHGNSKFIPEIYFFGSIRQRMNLLKGLMDTDGSIFGSGRMTFVSASTKLTLDVMRLVRSLGGKAKLNNTQNNAYHAELWLNEAPFNLPRKKERFVKDKRHWDNCNVVDIKRIPDEPSQCIAINSISHQFLAGEYFRTHNTGVRGAKEMGKRPTLAILDDLISDEDARSETVIKSIEDTVYKAVSYALHPKASKIFWSGTPFNQRDPLYKAVTSGGWKSNVYPVCEQFPCTKEEFRGSWPDRFTYEFVLEKYNLAMQTGEIASFNQELMLRIMSPEDRLITDSDIQWYDREAVLSKKNNYNFYITTDFATSEKTAADFSVISVWAVNNVGSWFWVDGLCKRQTMDKNIEALFNFVSMYKPMSVGVEVSGQQGGFVSFIQKEMIDKNIFFMLASENNDGKAGLRPNTNKMMRFNVVVPLFKAKKMYFPESLRASPEMAECMNELTLASAEGFKSKHDDFIDTISMLGSIKAVLPSENTPSLIHVGNGVFEEEVQETESSGYDSYLV